VKASSTHPRKLTKVLCSQLLSVVNYLIFKNEMSRKSVKQVMSTKTIEKSETTQTQVMATKTITIATVVDVVGALATDSLSGQIYFMDTNQSNGSTGQGTENLKTAVEQGDRLVWTITFLECEAYAAIDEIVIDRDYCDPEKKIYEGTDVSYWSGTIKKDVKSIPYNIRFKLGTRADSITTASPLYLVSRGS
jgi:hypothetical protein